MPRNHGQRRSGTRLVLANFGKEELLEFYRFEQLAFEVWRGAAVMRALGKGAPLRVFDNNELFFADDRSEQLNALIDRKRTSLLPPALCSHLILRTARFCCLDLM